MLYFESDLTQIKGIGEKKAESFSKMEINTIGDLMYHFPYRYENFKEPAGSLVELYPFAIPFAAKDEMFVGGQPACAVLARCRKVALTRAKGMEIVNGSFIIEKDQTELNVKWFRMGFLSHVFVPGKLYVLVGKVYLTARMSLLMEQPAFYDPEDYCVLMRGPQPVYHASPAAKIRSTALRKLLGELFEQYVFTDKLQVNDEVRAAGLESRYEMLPLSEALYGMHFPKSADHLVQSRRRIVFNEFYRFLKQVKDLKQQKRKIPNSFSVQYFDEIDRIRENLPFRLTDAQNKVIGEICSDMTSKDVTMNRMVQGDVGSGKTIVAFLTLILAAKNHYQGAMMAPTEVLARQHYEALERLNREQGLKLKIDLLTGSVKASEKKLIYQKIESGQTDIVIGTHALIQDPVHFASLCCVITDEQHRFGVRQREILAEKANGRMPHVLVMSATPIPRSLALILYADMDISIIDKMPNNRKRIRSCVIRADKRGQAYEFIKKELESGHQAYVICPAIEPSDREEAAEQMSKEEINVTDYTKYLQKMWSSEGYRICALHGKMKPAEKNRIMDAFLAHEIDVLVSTTVIEVGIDVANATVIMIESANSFGLAQLHQLRGRVGRSDLQSYCIFMDDSSGDGPNPRLDVMMKSDDGFEIAANDLRLRGPGDLFGVRQSGEMLFALGDIYADADLLAMAAEAVGLENDFDIVGKKN